MISYHARRGRIHLRIVAYHPQSEPGTALRVVVQAVDRGRPIAEDPIHVEIMEPLELASALSISRNEGWDLVPWSVAA